MFVFFTDSIKKEEHDGEKGQLSPSTSDIRNQYPIITVFGTAESTDSPA
jgi:hypothetical protein